MPDLPELGDWRLQRDDTLNLLAAPWTWTDERGTSVRLPAKSGEGVVFQVEGLASALISFGDRSITLYDVDVRADDAVVGQFVADQVLPRLLSHLSYLVLHAGAVEHATGRTALFVAPSGYGKSTLTGYLHDDGWPLLGDDAMLVRFIKDQVTARSVYRRLKLLPDSWAKIFPTPSSPAPRVGRKFCVDLASAGAFPYHEKGANLLVVALFFLSEPETAGGCRIERISASQACMELVRSSFALDPTDVRQAGYRLSQFGAIANAVPSFRLSYERDFGQLAQVREMIGSVLDTIPSPEAR